MVEKLRNKKNKKIKRCSCQYANKNTPTDAKWHNAVYRSEKIELFHFSFPSQTQKQAERREAVILTIYAHVTYCGDVNGGSSRMTKEPTEFSVQVIKI